VVRLPISPPGHCAKVEKLVEKINLEFLPFNLFFISLKLVEENLMKKIYPLSCCLYFSLILFSGNSIAQQTGQADSLLIQKPVQNWAEEEGRDSLQSESFRKRNGIIRSQIINGKPEVIPADTALIAPDRKPKPFQQPKKD
jgi:hypothetical protein